jgi:hypothetical protein
MTNSTTQLALTVPTPGYYSCWAETRNRCAGSGGVTWHPDEDAARAHAVASFNRGYRSWQPGTAPVAERVRVDLLVPGPDRGAWRDLSQAQRGEFTEDHPWFANRKASA